MRKWFLIAILAVSLFPRVHADGWDVFSRCMEWLIFSKKGYAKYIDVHAYVLDREQVAELLNDPEHVHPIQKSQGELRDKPVYLVVRLVQQENFLYSGDLAFSLNKRYLATLSTSGAGGEAQIPAEYNVIPLGTILTNSCSAKKLPQISWKWKQLYGV